MRQFKHKQRKNITHTRWVRSFNYKPTDNHFEAYLEQQWDILSESSLYLERILIKDIFKTYKIKTKYSYITLNIPIIR